MRAQPDSVLATNPTFLGNRLVLPTAQSAAPSADFEFQANNTSDGRVLVIDRIETYSLSGSDVRAPPSYVYVALGGFVALITLGLLHRRRHAVPIAVGMGAVVAIAVYARMTSLFEVTGLLDPDAIGFRTYADRFQWWPLFDRGIFSGNFAEREPLYVMIVHAYFQVMGSSRLPFARRLGDSFGCSRNPDCHCVQTSSCVMARSSWGWSIGRSKRAAHS